ncbi:MAG TPA: IS3 family transposase, partial [Gemmatimonadaceae bacterium]|nr:IS3 family transposase [Gemmatimonadaceae bacterium]
AVLAARIRAIHTGRRRSYGSPRVHRELCAQGVRCGVKRVARVMRTHGIRAVPPRRYRVTTQAGHRAPVAVNQLARRFGVGAQPGMNRVWAADLTYIPTREGWIYLAVILDLASRRVVGWAVRTRLDQDLALGALRMALRHRGARGGLHHSDRGVHYTTTAYQQLLAAARFTPSMSRVGDCWDNAVVESFFATLTKELLDVDGLFASRAIATRALVQFIEIWYNRQRRHSSLGYLSPAEFEVELETVS